MDDDDGLRSVDKLMARDGRLGYLRSPFGSGRMTQDDRHRLIAEYELAPSVPPDIRAHFNTARNLYLYAWYVARFHLVAEQHAMATLEMALRRRLQADGIVDKDGYYERTVPAKRPGDAPKVRKDRAMLRMLLTLAADHDVLRSDRIQRRPEWSLARARERVATMRHKMLVSQGVQSAESPAAGGELSEEDLNFDWIRHFAETMPDVRNDHAHGSVQLYSNVLWTFEVVQELVQQLFPGRQ